MLRRCPPSGGRISGFGWASGYVGSVALLLVIYLGFMSGSGSAARACCSLRRGTGSTCEWRCWLRRPGWRCWACHCCWFAHRLPDSSAASHPSTGLLGGYRKLWTEISAGGDRSRSASWWPARCSATGWRPFFAFGDAGVLAGRPMSDLWCGHQAWWLRVGSRVGGFVEPTGSRSKPVIVGSTKRHPSPPRRSTIHYRAVVRAGVLGVRAAVVCVHGPASLYLSTAAYGAARQRGVAFGLTMTGRAVSFWGRGLFRSSSTCSTRSVPEARRRVPHVDRPAAHARVQVSRHGGARDDSAITPSWERHRWSAPPQCAVLNPSHGDRAGDVVADVDDRDAGRMQGDDRLKASFPPRQEATLNSVCMTLPLSIRDADCPAFPVTS